jgi:hypothetical protein
MGPACSHEPAPPQIGREARRSLGVCDHFGCSAEAGWRNCPEVGTAALGRCETVCLMGRTNELVLGEEGRGGGIRCNKRVAGEL